MLLDVMDMKRARMEDVVGGTDKLLERLEKRRRWWRSVGFESGTSS